MSASYDYYKAFYYAGKYRNFTKAAELLMDNQSNVTRAMNNLEKELGCKLFVRSNRGVKLTPEGEILFRHIKIAHREIEVGEKALKAIREMKSGHVSMGYSIGVTELILQSYILPVLREYRKEYPDIRIRVLSQSTPEAIMAVQNGITDFAIVTTTEQAKISDPLKEVVLKSFQDILICGPSYRQLQKKEMTLSELLEQPIISLVHGTETCEFYERFFSSYGLVLNPDVEVATIDQVLPFVKNDIGLGFVTPDRAESALESGEVFELHLAEAIPYRNISLVMNREKPLSIAALLLAERIVGH